MKEKFKNIVFYVNIVVDVIVIGVVIYVLTKSIINEIKVSGSVFSNSINDEIKNYNSVNKIICDELQENEIIDLSYNYVIFKNGEMYSILSEKGKLYSNNSQCKKIDLPFKIKSVLNSYIVGDNNKKYTIEINYEKDNEIELKEETYYSAVTKKLLKDDDIVSYYSVYDDNKQKYFVLKNDGIIYEQEYDIKFTDDITESVSLISEEIALSNEPYGKINSFSINNNEITRVYTENGLYLLKEIGDDCQKYQDVKCSKELVLSDIYKKYSDEIKYIGSFYSLTKDNVIFTLETFSK